MPEINKITEKLNVIKPALFDIGIGKIIQVEITGVHLDNNGLLSVPVKATYKDKTIEGHFPLNTGNYRKIESVLGNNSDVYVGATFEAVCIPRNNPQTKAEVLSWSVLEETVKAKSK